jgi:putative hydrolase of the HAD superfamily
MYTSLRQDFGLSLSYREFRDLVSDRTLVAFPDVLQELHRVKQSRRLRVVLASNIEQHVWSGLNRKFDVKSAAHRAVLSYRLGILKPRKAFFEEALRREHARPEEVLYLDDSPENVRMARTLGIRSRLVRSRGETVRILQRLKRGRL